MIVELTEEGIFEITPEKGFEIFALKRWEREKGYVEVKEVLTIKL